MSLKLFGFFKVFKVKKIIKISIQMWKFIFPWLVERKNEFCVNPHIHILGRNKIMTIFMKKIFSTLYCRENDSYFSKISNFLNSLQFGYEKKFCVQFKFIFVVETSNMLFRFTSKTFSLNWLHCISEKWENLIWSLEIFSFRKIV